MAGKPFELRLVEDILAAGDSFALPGDAVHRALYLAAGDLSADGTAVAADSMCHRRGGVHLQAGPCGAAIWRWELAPAGSDLSRLADGASRLKLAHPLRLPGAPDLLLRGDSVAFPPGGCAFRHTHQGPGIRCLIEGGIRIDAEGASRSYAPGGAWFEAGPDPVFAQASLERPSRFVRVMVLPAGLVGKSSISYVDPADVNRPKSQTYRIYLDQPIELTV